MSTSESADAWPLLRRAVRRHRGRLAGSAALLTLWHVCETLVPVAMGLVIDRAVATGDVRAMVLGAVGIAVLFGCLACGFRFGSRPAWRAMHEERHLLRMEVAGRVLSPRGARTGRNAGQTLSIATGDAEIASLVLYELNFLLTTAISLTVAVVVLLWIHPGLGLLVVVGVPATLGLLQLLTPRITRSAEQQQERIAGATGAAADLVRGLRPLVGVGAQETALERYRVLSGLARDAGVRAAGATGRVVGAGQVGSGLLLALVALAAGLLAVDGAVTVGQLVTVVGMTAFLAEPVQMVTAVLASIARSRAGAGRIARFLASPPLVRTGAGRPRGTALVLDGLASGPLTGLSLRLQPGELVALLVTDPAAGERLVQVLAGQDEYEGAVTLGDVPLVDVDVDARRRTLVVNPHHADLLEGTLRSNVGGDEDVLPGVLEASAATDVVDLHEDGLDHRVTTDGTSLSGGQRQRIALARALAADPPVLVLHDPTTAVDAVTEGRIAHGLRSVRHAGPAPRSTLVLTSSPALLQVADRVLLVDAGTVRAEGTHAELMDLPAYREAVLT